MPEAPRVPRMNRCPCRYGLPCEVHKPGISAELWRSIWVVVRIAMAILGCYLLWRARK